MARTRTLEEYDENLRRQRERDARRHREPRQHHHVPGLDDELSDAEWEASARNRERELARARDKHPIAGRGGRPSRVDEAAASEHESRPREGRAQFRESLAAGGRRTRSAARTVGSGMSALATGEWKGVTPAGLMLGFFGWAAALNVLRYGPAGLSGWFRAKFFNEPMQAAAARPAKAQPKPKPKPKRGKK